MRCTDGIHAGSAEMKSLSGISLSLHSSLPKANPNEDIESFDAYGAHQFTIVSFLLLLRSVVFTLSLIISSTMFAAVLSVSKGLSAPPSSSWATFGATTWTNLECH